MNSKKKEPFEEKDSPHQDRHPGTSRKGRCVENGVDLCSPDSRRTRYIKDFIHPVLGKMDIYVTPEVYKAYWESRNREARQRREEMRCIVLNPNLLPVICHGDCDQCPGHDSKLPQIVSLDGPLGEVTPDMSEDIPSLMSEKDRMEALRREISFLPGERDRKILGLTLGNRTPTEIAEMLGVSVSYVSKRLAILTARLRERLKEYR